MRSSFRYWVDRFAEGGVYSVGVLLMAVIVAVFYYLAHESKYAFDQKFTYGFRFSLQHEVAKPGEEVSMDPNSSVLTAHADGAEGIDDKEDRIYMPTIESLKGSGMFGTGTVLKSDLKNINSEELYRDDWRSPKEAKQGDRFLLFGFASPEFKEPKMALAWEPDQGFLPHHSPYDLKLRLARNPAGAEAPPFEIDLKKQPKGRVVVPAFVARTDAERTQGYVFEMVATPAASGFWTTVRNLFRTEWAPTNVHPTFGFIPLLIGTFVITLIAILIATPISIASAIYMSEVAPTRVREWLKPIIELLSSIPTVVLGYFGLMLVAPFMQKTFAAALGLESGRALLTTGLVMAVLLIPTITTVAEDALRTLPNTLRDGAMALGLTAREALKNVIVPAAKGGLTAAVLLGIARSLGETMLLWILSGGTPTMFTFASAKDAVSNLMKPTRGIPDTIGIEMGNVTFETPHYGHLFLIGLVLFVFTLIINLAGYRLVRRSAWRA